MRVNQAKYSIALLCRVFGISRSGYYAWLARPPSRREVYDATLRERICSIHKHSRGTYGAPRIHAELADEGCGISGKRIARLMKEQGLQGVTRRKGFRTTIRDAESRPAPDLVERNFNASGPDELWVADITYIPTLAGFLFLAVVLDVWSRRIVGWAMRDHLRTELVVEALEMALHQRNPSSVIHHSDQGTQYTSIGFGDRCTRAGVRPSMGSVGDCFDNAMCESFFASLECELIDRKSWKTRTEAGSDVFDYIEGWYNPHRRHSALGYKSPVDFEQSQRTEKAA